jgi:hypothetical protein
VKDFPTDFVSLASSFISLELCLFTVFLFYFVPSSLRALDDQVKRSLGGTAMPYVLHKWITLYSVIGDLAIFCRPSEKIYTNSAPYLPNIK